MLVRRVSKLALYLLLVLPLSLLSVEMLTRLGYRAVRGKWFEVGKHQSTAHAPAMGEEGSAKPRNDTGLLSWPGAQYVEALHPYLGFVPVTLAQAKPKGVLRVIRSRSANKRIVAVFGGSFAGGVCLEGRDALKNALSEPGKTVEILCLAAPGYKQPQQLMALTYVLSLGGAFDLIINIDGFNEVALPLAENVPKGVFPIYPRAWFLRLQSVDDPLVTTHLIDLAALDREHKRWVNLQREWGLHHSIAVSLLWRRVERAYANERNQLVERMDELQRREDLSYAVTGPEVTFEDDSAAYEYLAKVWRDSSIQMKRISDGNDIDYYHFLQPNQYVQDSKPMTESEKRVAIRETHRYRPGVVAGYPILIRLGRDLVDAGVNYVDLTMMFRDVEEPLYKDDCCHLNPMGYEMTARRIGSLIRAEGSQN